MLISRCPLPIISIVLIVVVLGFHRSSDLWPVSCNSNLIEKFSLFVAFQNRKKNVRLKKIGPIFTEPYENPVF